MKSLKQIQRKIFSLALTVLLLCSSAAGIKVQAAEGIEINRKNFASEGFADYLRRAYDENKDGYLSKEECEKVELINIGKSGMHEVDVNSDTMTAVKGLENFPNLREFNCSYTPIALWISAKIRNYRF